MADINERWNVFAVIGFALAFVSQLISLVFCIIALSKIQKTGERGRGLAIAGVIIDIVLIITVILLLAFGVIPIEQINTML